MDAVQMFDSSQREAEDQGLDDALRPRSRAASTALATVLGASSAQGCCDPAVALDTSLEGTWSTSEGGSTDSTGEAGLPEWAIGSFSSESDKVGMTIENPYWYGWLNMDISATGSAFLDLYTCSEHRERQEFRWTTDGGRSLSLQPVPPSDVFDFGAGGQVSDVVIEPSDSCDKISIRYFHVDARTWIMTEFQRGDVCARPTGAEGCAFTFEWCNGEPPAPCE